MSVRWYNKETGQMEDYNPPPRPDVPFQIMPMFQEYQAVGIDGSIVKTRTDHKNLLKQHGCEEMGNEKPAWMKDRAEQRAEQRAKGDEK